MTVRIVPVPNDSDNPLLSPVFDQFRNAGLPVPILYRILGHAPKMLEAWTSMAWNLRANAKTDRGLRELIIMRVALLSREEYEWNAHWPASIKFGVSQNQLKSLGDWKNSDCFSGEERIVLQCTDEITTEGGVSRKAFNQLAGKFSSESCIELILTATFYSCVSRTLNSFGIKESESTQDCKETYHQNIS